MSGDADTLSVLEVGVLCNNAVLIDGGREIEGIPVEKAILRVVHQLEMVEDFRAPYQRFVGRSNFEIRWRTRTYYAK